MESPGVLPKREVAIWPSAHESGYKQLRGGFLVQVRIRDVAVMAHDNWQIKTGEVGIDRILIPAFYFFRLPEERMQEIVSGLP